MIKRTAAVLLMIIFALSLTGCGKDRSELEMLAGYYEADLEKAVPVLYSTLSSEECDMKVADMRSSGYIYSLTLDKKGKGTVNLTIGGEEMLSEEISFDPDKGTAQYGGNDFPYEYKSGTIEMDGLTFNRMSKPSEAAWPFGGFVQVEGEECVGYFWVPDDWSDATDRTAEDLVIEFASPDEDYDLTVFSYQKEEWQYLDGEVFGSPLALLDALLSDTREKYADSLEADDTFETEVDGCEAVRNDMTFSDGTGYTSVVYRDAEDTYHVIMFETFSKDATSHMDDFVQYVVGHFKAKQ